MKLCENKSERKTDLYRQNIRYDRKNMGLLQNKLFQVFMYPLVRIYETWYSKERTLVRYSVSCNGQQTN